MKKLLSVRYTFLEVPISYASQFIAMKICLCRRHRQPPAAADADAAPTSTSTTHLLLFGQRPLSPALLDA
jgi:hypothetical protein